MRKSIVVASIGFGFGCGADSDDPLPPPDDGDGFQIAMTTRVEPGQEAWKCVVSETPDGDWMAVNRAESVQSVGMHHMDIMALLFT
jgi:hypothetical protein